MAEKKVRIYLDLDTGQVIQKVGKVKVVLRDLNKEAKRASTGLDATSKSTRSFVVRLRDMVIILGQARNALHNISLVTTSWLGSIVRVNREMEQLTKLMEGFSTQTTKAGREQEALASKNYLLNMAQSAPFALKSITDAFVKLKASGIDPTNGSLQSLLDGIANFGGTDDELHRASIAIRQIIGKGALSMEELRQQLGETIPNAINIMADSARMTYADFVKQVSLGNVKAAESMVLLFEGLDRNYGGRAAAMMETINGALAKLKTSWVEFSSSVGDSGFNDSLRAALGELSTLLSSKKAAEFGATLGSVLVGLLNAFVEISKITVEYLGVIKLVGVAFATYFAVSRIGPFFAALNGGITKSKGVFGKLTKEMNINKVAIKGYAAEYSKAVRLAKKGEPIWGNIPVSTRNLAGMNRMLRLTTTSMNIFRSAVAGMGGPIAIAIAVIGSLTYKFISLRREANKTVEDIINGTIRLDNISDLKKFEEAYAKLPQIIEDTKAEIERKEKALTSTSLRDNQKVVLESSIKDLKEYLVKLLDTKKEYKKKEAAALNDLAETEGTKQFTDDFNVDQSGLRAQYREETAKLSKEFNSGKLESKDFGDAMVEEEKKLVDGLIATTDRLISKYKEKLSGLKEGTHLYNKYSGALEKAKEQYADLTEKRSNIKDYDPKGLLMDSSKIEGHAFSLENLQSRYMTLSGQVAQAEAELNGTGDTLADINARIEAPDLDKFTYEEMADKVKKLAAEFDNLKHKLDINNQTTSATESAYKTFEGLSERLATKQEELSQKLSHPALRTATKDMNKYQESVNRSLYPLAQLADESEEAAATLKKLTAEGEAMGRNYYKAIVDSMTSALDLETREIEEALLTQNQQREINYQREITRINTLLELENLTAAQRVQLQETVSNRLAALQRKNDVEALGSLGQWALAAKDLDTNMQDATTSWIDGFTNDLVEVELSFGKFAKAILKDLLKMIIQGILAKTILSSLGLGGGTGGGDLQYDITPVTTSRVPTNHGGGIAGSESAFSKLVPSSVFANAKRYHEGGIPGLKSNEIPTVLERGEGVFTKGQMKALGGMAGNHTEINIINNSGMGLGVAESNQRDQSGKMIIDIVVEAMNKPGPMRDSVRAVSNGVVSGA